MQIIIDIPEEQIKKSLEESKSIHEDEGIKGFVNIVMLYTNGRLEFVNVERREDFYSCNFKPQIECEDIAKAFQLGTAMGFAEKYDAMDRVIEELKKTIATPQESEEEE